MCGLLFDKCTKNIHLSKYTLCHTEADYVNVDIFFVDDIDIHKVFHNSVEKYYLNEKRW